MSIFEGKEKLLSHLLLADEAIFVVFGNEKFRKLDEILNIEFQGLE